MAARVPVLGLRLLQTPPQLSKPNPPKMACTFFVAFALHKPRLLAVKLVPTTPFCNLSLVVPLFNLIAGGGH